jgi:hypothetical protein
MTPKLASPIKNTPIIPDPPKPEKMKAKVVIGDKGNAATSFGFDDFVEPM